MKYCTLASMLALTAALGSHFDLVRRVYTCSHDFQLTLFRGYYLEIQTRF